MRCPLPRPQTASTQPTIGAQQAKPGSLTSRNAGRGEGRDTMMATAQRRRDAEAELNLPPGFRFHPTDEELVVHYLCRKAAGLRLPVPIIAEVDLYKFDPWDLPEKALFGQREWYFFTPRDRKYPNGSRPNRAAGKGYWKATGADKPVAPRGAARAVGIKKALVFYAGKAPRGAKTDWIMHEYRLADAGRGGSKKGTLRLDDWVLCRLYNKKNEWEKMQQQKQHKEEEDTLSNSLHTTTESEIDNDPFPELDSFPALRGAGMSDTRGTSGAGYQMTVAPQVPKKEAEEDCWFMDLNLDDLQSAYASLDVPSEDFYLPAFASPRGRTNQNNSIAPF